MLLLSSVAPVQAGDEPSIEDFSARLVEGAWVTSLRVEGAFSEKIDDEIRSGLPVTFRYFVEIYRKRRWIRSRIVVHELDVTVDFDSLTRQYRLTRELNGEVVASSETEKEEEMHRWMTEVQDLQVGAIPPDTPEGAIFLRVKCRVSSRFVAFFFPYAQETGWARLSLERSGEVGEEG